jgi:predicted ATPase with chaperone activity
MGGQIAGPRLQGRVVPQSGGDWPLFWPGGLVEFEAHYQLEAADGTPIYIHNRGIAWSSPDVLARLEAFRIDSRPLEIEAAHYRWNAYVRIDPAARSRLAETFLSMGQPLSALVQLKRAWKAGTNLAGYVHRRPRDLLLAADCAMRLSLFDEAEEYLDRCIEADDRSEEARRAIAEKAKLLYLTNRYAELREHAEEAVNLYPDDPTLHTLLAHAYWNLGAWEPASRSYERARALDPENGLIALNAARGKERLGETEAAFERYLAAANLFLKTESYGDLPEAVAVIRGERDPSPVRRGSAAAAAKSGGCLSEVKGQAIAKRALEVAAAGGHNLLMMGLPGSGKTMLARCLPSILPPLSREESLTVTKIYSVAGILEEGCDLLAERPFRSPHHSISYAGLAGGGSPLLRPGEISLAHGGVLFLDEMPEFRRDALEVLRQPLEEGRVTISRSSGKAVFPALFMLVASMNPCPCGFRGDTVRPCTCSSGTLRRYLNKLSGPLLDRIDMQIEVPRLTPAELRESAGSETSEAVRERVLRARRLQEERAGAPGACNARLSPSELMRQCRLDDAAEGFLLQAVNRLGLTARGYHRCLRVARTIADLAGRERIEAADLAEAVQYRSLERCVASLY